jgi:P pilus assembly chaperone PapD
MKKNHNAVCLTVASLLLSALLSEQASAAIALDRTRVIFDGTQKSVSLNVRNENKELPYLAQGWIEDDKGNKITSPLIVLPPVQRIDAGLSSQVKVQGLPETAKLPQDRESIFYFNLREIPPRSQKPNTLQIALQTRVKLFYRPAAIVQPTPVSTPWEEGLTLTRTGDKYQVNNPTPYYITLVDGSPTANGNSAPGFEPVMAPPKGAVTLSVSAAALGSSPVLTYINDYGARPQLQFTCSGGDCKASPVKDSK